MVLYLLMNDFQDEGEKRETQRTRERLLIISAAATQTLIEVCPLDFDVL